MLARLIEALAPYLSLTQCDVALDQIDLTAGFLGSSARALAYLRRLVGLLPSEKW